MSGGERDFHRRWSLIAVPLRPPPPVAAAMAALVVDRPGLALQLGVTPEIAAVPTRSIAVDWDEQMVRLAWLGGPGRAAVVADWRALPLGPASIAMVIGDASLTMLRWPADALWAELARVLAPGSRIVLRCFAGPEPAESPASLRSEALAGQAGSFAAFKLRLNMALFAQHERAGAITSQQLFDGFTKCFPDRGELLRATGWTEAEVAQIDRYAGSVSLHAYPVRSRILAALPWPGRFVEVGGYELAGLCPLLVIDLP